MNRKRMSLALAVAAAFVLASIGWLVPWSRNSQAAPAPSGGADFKGKVLFVYTGSMGANIFVLEKARLQKIGDRSCLVGKGASAGPMVGWNKGRTVWLPMEQIISITEFDDVKDAMKVFKEGGIGMPIGYAPLEAGSAPSTPLPTAVPVDRPARKP